MSTTGASRFPATLVAVAAVGAALVLIVALTRTPMSSVSPTPSPAGSLTAVSSPSAPSATPSRSAGPNEYPSAAPTPGPCTPPESLPRPVAPIATPAVAGASVATLFSSALYRRDPSGTLVARDNPDADWAIGLWFAEAGSDAPRLLAAAEDGMLLPLGLSPAGDVAAVWWLQDRRRPDEPACTSGIYLLSTADGASRLIEAADRSHVADDGDGLDGNGLFWQDDDVRFGSPRTYRLPEVSFSADGRFMAFLDGGTIELHSVEPHPVVRQHLGECRDWAWSPAGAVFVAGCEDMTSAWIVDVGEGLGAQSVPIPIPDGGWGLMHDPWDGRSIGLLPDGRIRVSRFHGFATGCEQPDCTLPPVGWSITTIKPGTGAATFASAEVDFIVASLDGDSTHLAADGSWVYAEVETSTQVDGRFVRFGAGIVTDGPLIGTFLGASADGSVIYGSQPDSATGRVVVSTFDRNADRRPVATIDAPEGATGTSPVIALWGLHVARAGT